MKKKLNFKVINDIRSLWIEMSLAKLNLSKQKGVPIRKILYQMEKIFFKIVDYYFFITIDHKKHYEEMLGQKFPASLIIPNALENFQITEKLDNKKKNEKVIFGYIGALQEMRGLRKIFNTFCDIEGVELHLYGTPKIKNLPKNVLLQRLCRL